MQVKGLDGKNRRPDATQNTVKCQHHHERARPQNDRLVKLGDSKETITGEDRNE